VEDLLKLERVSDLKIRKLEYMMDFGSVAVMVNLSLN